RTNATDGMQMNIASPRNTLTPGCRMQSVAERLTMVRPNTFFYAPAVRDPVVITAPFKLASPWTRNDGYRMFEYACHEGNTVVPNYIKTTSPRFVGTLENPSDPAEWVRDTVQR